jgi:selenocysteine-specific elongation factor
LIGSRLVWYVIQIMRTLVVGTAGHIDHGKTALVKALTGVDTDRLPEEQARGITIDLGFAYLELDGALRLSIVDVPGHEKFVSNMVAGTGGIDLVLLVVAADEGVMPQTREHLDICGLLGIRRGLVALTKTDLVDGDWQALVQEDLKKELQASFLAEAPIVPVSARTGAGLDELRRTLGALSAEVDRRPHDAPTFLAVDRSFSKHGFGTVVTGTLVSGRLRLEDAVAVVPDPSGRLGQLKVRGLQSHGQTLEVAEAGQRLAVNLTGVERTEIHRGQVLTHAGEVRADSTLEVALELLPGARPVRNRTEYQLHTGTARCMALVHLVGTDQLRAGERAHARLLCEQPVAALPGQRFLLRGTSIIPGRGTTLAGGPILGILPPRFHRREAEGWLRDMAALEEGAPAARLEIVLRRAGPSGEDLAGLCLRTGQGRRQVERELEPLLVQRRAVKFDREAGRFASGEVVQALQERLLALLAEFHAAAPLLPGMPAERLRTSLDPELDPRLFRVLLQGLERGGQTVAQAELVRLAGHRVALDSAGSSLERDLEELFARAGLAPPRLEEAARAVGRPGQAVQDMLRHLVRQGRLAHLGGDLFIDQPALAGLGARLVAHLVAHQAITTQEFKAMVGGSRKHVIPLAEYFDGQKITLRVGERRVLRGSPGAATAGAAGAAPHPPGPDRPGKGEP